MKTQASFPSLHLGSLLEHSHEKLSFARAVSLHWCTSCSWLTDLWLLKLQPFTRIEMVSPALAKYGPSLHLTTGHWEQIWMNFNWKSWKMLSAGHWVIYDITLIPGVSAKNGSNCSTEEKCKQWMRNIKCTFRLLGYHCQKLWKDLDFETCLIMVASGWSAQIWQRLSIFPTKGFYHLRTNISIRLLSLSVSVLGIILTSLHCVVLPLV